MLILAVLFIGIVIFTIATVVLTKPDLEFKKEDDFLVDLVAGKFIIKNAKEEK